MEDTQSTTNQVETVELFTEEEINRTISRIAYQIIEKTALDATSPQHVVLLGIPSRGVNLATRLQKRIADIVGTQVPTGSLDITLYRDDLNTKPPRSLHKTFIPDPGIDGVHVILVDDVLYSGRSIRSALDALSDIGRPATVQLAVLIDRGHRELPIRADYVGKNIPTSSSESVHVQLQETDGQDSIVLERACAADSAGEKK